MTYANIGKKGSKVEGKFVGGGDSRTKREP